MVQLYIFSYHIRYGLRFLAFLCTASLNRTPCYSTIQIIVVLLLPLLFFLKYPWVCSSQRLKAKSKLEWLLVQNVVEVSCRRTELKRCSDIDRRWNRNDDARSSPEKLLSCDRDHSGTPQLTSWRHQDSPIIIIIIIILLLFLFLFFRPSGVKIPRVESKVKSKRTYYYDYEAHLQSALSQYATNATENGINNVVKFTAR